MRAAIVLTCQPLEASPVEVGRGQRQERAGGQSGPRRLVSWRLACGERVAYVPCRVRASRRTLTRAAAKAGGRARAEVGVDASPVPGHAALHVIAHVLRVVTDDVAHHAVALGVVQSVPYKRR